MQENKHIFVATHPRSCSTAFERVFMTCNETLSCVHEPFGEAWYFGPERLSPRFKDQRARLKSGHATTTYRDVFEAMDLLADKEGKRLFIKDMAQYLMSPGGPAPSLAPSLSTYRRGVATKGDTAITNGHHHEKEARNPTVVPDSLLSKYHFTFLIRHPRSAVPSYYRCTVPPLSSITGFDTFDPAEAGYHELRLFFDYLRSSRQIGPGSKVDICVVDADDLLNNPTGTVEAYCRFIGMPFSQNMLKWNDEQNLAAQEAFEKWKGFHEDALNSKELKARTQKKAPKSDEQLFAEWTEKFGAHGAEIVAKTVQENVEDYEYLKQFALKV